MRKYLCVLLALAILLSLAACGGKDSDGTADTDGSTEGDTSAVDASDTPDTARDTTPPEPARGFPDVPEDAFYYDAAMWAAENGLVSGDKFDPMGICNRGQMLTLLWRAMGSPEPAGAENPFTDGDPSSWFYKPALWAYETGIISAGAVSANGACPMGQLLTILWRANGSPITAAGVSAVANKYPGQYYEKALAWADLCGLLNAIGQAFDPNASCTRATVVLYLYWLKDNFSLSAEDAAVQAEYAKLVADAPLYGVTGDGLVYADYIDVEGDGKVELLTVGLGDGEDYYKNLTLTVYANVDGHAGKVAEFTDEINIIVNHVTFTLSFDPAAEGPCLNYYDTSENPHTFYEDFGHYLLESNAVSKAEIGQSYAEYYDVEGEEGQTISGVNVTAEEFRAAADKNNTGTPILTFQSSFGEVSATIENSGLLPGRAEINTMIISGIKSGDERITKNAAAQIESGNSELKQLVLDMALGGDFTFFAGEYEPTSATKNDYYAYKSLTLHADGRVTGYESDYYTSGKKPVSVNVNSQGVITCVIIPEERYVVEDFGGGDVLYDFIGEWYQIIPDSNGGYENATIYFTSIGGGAWDPTFIRVSD